MIDNGMERCRIFGLMSWPSIDRERRTRNRNSVAKPATAIPPTTDILTTSCQGQTSSIISRDSKLYLPAVLEPSPSGTVAMQGREAYGVPGFYIRVTRVTGFCSIEPQCRSRFPFSLFVPSSQLLVYGLWLSFVHLVALLRVPSNP